MPGKRSCEYSREGDLLPSHLILQAEPQGKLRDRKHGTGRIFIKGHFVSLRKWAQNREVTWVKSCLGLYQLPAGDRALSGGPLGGCGWGRSLGVLGAGSPTVKDVGVEFVPARAFIGAGDEASWSSSPMLGLGHLAYGCTSACGS